MKVNISYVARVVSMGLVLNLAACASMQTALENKDKQVESKMSNTIFKDESLSGNKNVYVSITNTSGKDINVSNRIKKAISSHGYKIVSKPNYAQYILQANILKVGKMSKSASQRALGGGYGSALAGFATGTTIGALSNNANTALGAGVAGGLISMAADSLVKVNNYSMITDVQLSERTREVVKEQTRSNLSNGLSSQTTQSSSKGSHWKKSRTRVVSSASQLNLSFSSARPDLEQSLVKTLSGIF